jgi:hypothetical protein
MKTAPGASKLPAKMDPKTSEYPVRMTFAFGA